MTTIYKIIFFNVKTYKPIKVIINKMNANIINFWITMTASIFQKKSNYHHAYFILKNVTFLLANRISLFLQRMWLTRNFTRIQ